MVDNKEPISIKDSMLEAVSLNLIGSVLLSTHKLCDQNELHSVKVLKVLQFKLRK